MIEPASDGVSRSEVQEMIDGAVGPVMNSVSLSESPGEGGTVTLPAIPNDIFLTLSPAADRSLVTVVLPPESADRQNQALRIRSTRNITSLMITGATTVDNSEVMLNANSVTVFFKFAPDTWSRTV